MKICVAQTKPVKGDIKSNIEQHKKLINLAITNGADSIIFPELSLTGYEPELAKELATTANDPRLNDFQQISDTRQVTIGVGIPLKNKAGIYISMVIFQPQQQRQTYSKKYLHADEEPFFTSGENTVDLLNSNTALAICYEITVPQHAEDAFKKGATIYIASVAKSASGVEKAMQRLATIASTYSMTVVMSNCVGYCDNFESTGNSAAWNNKGLLLDQLSNHEEGLLIIDTATQQLVKKIIV